MAHNRQKSNKTNANIHVLHVASGDLWAGAEVMLYTLASAMHNADNIRVSVVLLNDGMLAQKLRDTGIDVFTLDETHHNTVELLRRLNAIVRKIKPDIIHSHRLKENILASLAAWRNRIPSLRTSHGAPEHKPPFYKLPKRMVLSLDRFLGRYCQQYIVAVSSDLAGKLSKNFPASMIKVIENGIDIAALTKERASPESHRDDGHFHIGIAGRLVPVKRVDLFIEAATLLKQEHPERPFQFHIYGDGPLFSQLNQQVLSQQASDYIHFEGHSEKLSKELVKLDALLMTSDHEGLPMVLLEAMCLHVPVIAHAVGGIPRLLDDGRCGTLVQDHSAKAFADALFDLAAQPGPYQQRAAQAYARIEQNYSAENTAQRYIELYHEVLK